AQVVGSGTGQLQAGQQLELECLPHKEDSGAFWVRQDKSGTLHFIVFISHMNKATFEGSQKTSPRFQAEKVSRSYQLQVKSFQPQDEGNYFCLVISNQVLYFSRGLPAFLPATTTPAAATTQPGTTQQDPCPESPDTGRAAGRGRAMAELSFSCDIFIWIPLAGACLLLLIALLVTVLL
ncbi:CD8A protein, partial [Psilopogon haemacephalus]|nr:CD8A protein [Psilopogon haemacephalus]